MLTDLLSLITGWLSDLVLSLGTAGILVVALLENLFPPTPSEFLYPLAGKLTYDGLLSFGGVIVAGICGTLIGATIYYGLGYRLGKEKTRHWVATYGTLHFLRWRWIIISTAQYDRALAAFEKYDSTIVIFGRLMPLVHGVVSLPAGVVRMPYWRFLLYTAIGATLWIAPLTALGYGLGSQWMMVLDWLGTYQYIVYGMIALGIAWWLLHHHHTRDNDGQSHPS